MRNYDNSNSYFETSDLTLASTLAALGYFIHHLDTSNPARVIFFFAATAPLQSIISDFWAGKTAVEPKTFNNTQREIKSRIRNELLSQ